MCRRKGKAWILLLFNVSVWVYFIIRYLQYRQSYKYIWSGQPCCYFRLSVVIAFISGHFSFIRHGRKPQICSRNFDAIYHSSRDISISTSGSAGKAAMLLRLQLPYWQWHGTISSSRVKHRIMYFASLRNLLSAFKPHRSLHWNVTYFCFRFRPPYWICCTSPEEHSPTYGAHESCLLRYVQNSTKVAPELCHIKV